MLKRYHHWVGTAFRFVDAFMIGAAWLASYWARFNLPLIEVTKGFPKFETYSALTPLVVILWVTILSSSQAYRGRRILRRTHEVHLLLKAHGVALLVFVALTYLFSEYRYSRGVMVYFGVLGALFLVGTRLLLRNLLRAVRSRGFNLRHILIVGEGGVVETLVQRIEKFPELGFRVLGAVIHEDSQAQSVAGKPVLGRFGQIAALLRSTRADQLLIALPRPQYGDLDRVLGAIRDETVEIQLVPDIHEYVTLGCEVEDFEGLPIVNINDSPLRGWGAIAKRVTDFIFSGFALLVLSPLLLCIAVLIKLTSRGPLLYRQERMGLDGRTFEMLKFRSMQADAEAKTGAVWTVPSDSRRTGLGAFLRATSIDELPQLWNILRGDMALVGPRPERPVFVQKFRTEIPHYMLRHKVKAGLTGWAQVNGWRGNTSLERRIECDLYYIRNWSYLLDWKIIWLTIWRGFIHKNAY